MAVATHGARDLELDSCSSGGTYVAAGDGIANEYGVGQERGGLGRGGWRVRCDRMQG